MVVGLDSNFTKIFKKNILSLQSKKAITLYELLKSYAGRTFPPTISIEDLKEKLDMKSSSYNIFKDFYKRGISDPLKEINENTDIFVTVVKLMIPPTGGLQLSLMRRTIRRQEKMPPN